MQTLILLYFSHYLCHLFHLLIFIALDYAQVCELAFGMSITCFLTLLNNSSGRIVCVFVFKIAVCSLQTLLERLDSKDWLVVCEALNHVRQLSIFHKEAMLPIL